MRCTLLDQPDPLTTQIPTTSGSGLGGRSAPIVPYSLRSTHKRGTDTIRRALDEHIRQITSITISRDGQVVAHITPYTAAGVETDVDKLNVKISGDVSGNGAELG